MRSWEAVVGFGAGECRDGLQLESKSLICLLFGEQDYEEAERGGSVILHPHNQQPG